MRSIHDDKYKLINDVGPIHDDKYRLIGNNGTFLSLKNLLSLLNNV